MANEQNLITLNKRTVEERRKIAKKDAIAENFFIKNRTAC